MARSSAVNIGSRSQQAGGAEARDPWEDALAELRSRESSTPSDLWGTGNRQSTEAPVNDTWGTGASTEALATNNWGTTASKGAPVTDPWGWRPRALRVAPVTDGWGTMASTEAPVTDTWGTRASTEALATNNWGTTASTGAPVTDPRGWRPRALRVAPVTDGWGTMAWTEAPVTDSWRTRASEPARGSWGRSAPERSSFTVPPPSESEVRMSITVGNAKAFLHCGGCSLPLKPPIFQCDAGHAVCLACRDELLDRGTGWTCNVCRGPGFRRSGFLDNLVESLRVACPYAARGCGARPAYYDLHAHRAACAHAPGTPCPVRGCSFVAPVAGLLDHFAAVHGWPINDEERVGKSFDIDLCDGFNVVAAAVRDGGNQQHVLLLNVVRQPFGRTISAVCIHPQLAVAGSCDASVTKTVELELCYSAARHYQESVFSVPFVDLTDGLPNELAQFVVPKSVHPDDHATIPVTAFLTIK